MAVVIENPTEFRENLRGKLNTFIKNKTCSVNLEKAVFNFAIKTAKEKKIVRK